MPQMYSESHIIRSQRQSLAFDSICTLEYIQAKLVDQEIKCGLRETSILVQ